MVNQERIIVSEASLSHLLSATSKSFAIITAYRSNFKKPENTQRNRRLCMALNAMRAGIYQLIGYWREHTDCPSDKLRDVVERSYFVQKPDTLSLDNFVSTLNSLATKYNQDAFILYDGTIIWAVDRNGNKQRVGNSVGLGRISQAYSQHIKKSKVPFVFEGLEVPTSNIGRQLWQQSGLVVPPAADQQHDMLVETVN